MYVRFWLENPNERDNLGNLEAGGRILKWILQNQDIIVWSGFIWLRIWPGSWQYGNEPSNYIK
jgi:hypothetical protein